MVAARLGRRAWRVARVNEALGSVRSENWCCSRRGPSARPLTPAKGGVGKAAVPRVGNRHAVPARGAQAAVKALVARAAPTCFSRGR